MAETIREYLDTVQEQIRWKRARPVVARELEQHLNDQRGAFLEEGNTPETAERLAVEEMGDPVTVGTELDRVHRPKPQWWLLTAKPGTFDEKDVVAQLDVSILQNNLLTPILGIGDPRTDKRIDFIGGIRGLGELERRVNEGMAVAFAMCPTSIEDLMSIANSGRIMPPKSTWFEPKLLSGIFIHELK